MSRLAVPVRRLSLAVIIGASLAPALVLGLVAEARADEYDELFGGPRKEPGTPPPVTPAAPQQRQAARPESDPPETGEQSGARVAGLVPKVALQAGVRLGYNGWLTGKVNELSASEVWSPATGVGLSGGLRFAQTFVVFATWERMPFGVGDGSPYSKLDSAKGYGEMMAAGMRFYTNAGRVAALFEVAMGSYKLHQEGEDSAGGTASFDSRSFVSRMGAGLSIRINRNLAIEPVAALHIVPVSKMETKSNTASGVSFDNPEAQNQTGTSLLGGQLAVHGTFDLALSRY